MLWRTLVQLYLQQYSQQIKHAIKTAIAALLASILYFAFKIPNGYWAIITAVIVMQMSMETGSLESTIKIGAERFIGTVIGSAAALLFLLLFSLNHWSIYPWELLAASTIFVLVGSYLSYFYRSLNLMGVTAVIVLLGGGTHNDTVWHLAAFRSLSILFGVLIALSVTLVLWPYRLHTFLRGHVATSLQSICQLYTELLVSCLQKSTIPKNFETTRQQVIDKIKQDELFITRLSITGLGNYIAISKMLYLELSFTRHLKTLSEIVPNLSNELHYSGFPEAVNALMQAVKTTLEQITQQIQQLRNISINFAPITQQNALLEQMLCEYREKRLQRISYPIPFQENHAFFSFFYELSAIARVTTEMAETINKG
jgi:uncharacterized membrane protein YccC